ncbi:O-antigen ligase family protein [Spiribacter curvatus]|uniref:O-antigen ligase family protein n=1 Tax=Spiribacter curvatus TaxID=1335757 RepID=UPI0011D2284B|nr:O-antigen ligase [Spiribacter curvatus]
MNTASASNPPTPTPTPTPPRAPLTRSEQFITAAVFLFPALALTVPDGYSIGAVALLIAAVTHLVANRRTWAQQPPLPTAVKAVIAFMILYALYWMGDAALRGEGLREFDRPSRFLLAAFCLSVFAQARIQQGALWLGLAVGGIGTGGLAITQKLIEGHSRANGFAQTIQFGNASMLIGLMCLAGTIWAASRPTTRRGRALTVAILILGGIGGLTGSFLSGSRGAWLALGPALLIGLWAAVRLGHTRRYLVLAPMALALLVAAVYLQPATGVAHRITGAAQQLEHYIDGTDRTSSVGYRLDMWKGAWRLFKSRPLTGWGEQGYIERTRELGASGYIASGAAQFTHAHNEWFNTLVKKGIIGGAVLLGLYLMPAVCFLRLRTRPPGDPSQTLKAPCLAVATAGLIFMFGFMATGLTQVNFNHNIGAMTFAFMTAVLVGLSVDPARRSPVDDT